MPRAPLLRLTAAGLALPLAAAASSGDFLHGVASGDPLSDAVIIWTRVTPRTPSPSSSVPVLPVQWAVWPEAEGSEQLPAANGTSLASADQDYTVKVDVSGLRSGTPYAFQFTSGSARSSVGRFRLPPAKDSTLASLRYAVFSCANWKWGTFAAYGKAALHDLDFWLHLGDFIYENGLDTYPANSAEIVRPGLDPANELLSLEDYRRRHAQYRTDVDLQTLAAAAPMIPIWDDHEVANDGWMHGAENHQQETEGSFEARKAAAMRAYHEWMPTRPDPTPPWIRRKAFDFGDLATLVVLETRLGARTSQAELTGEMVWKRIASLVAAPDAPTPDKWPKSDLEKQLLAIRDETESHRRNVSKRLLGDEQLAWLRACVSGSAARWKLVGQQLQQPVVEANFEEAIRRAHAGHDEGSLSLLSRWASAWSNATTVGATYLFESPLPYDKAKHGRRFEIDAGQRLFTLSLLAAGRYNITVDFDSWSGYVAERGRFLQALETGNASDTVVYGGDSHNAWAGVLRAPSGRVVAKEFDGMSVSSPGMERYLPWLPADLRSEAFVVANPDLKWADTAHRGFMLVTLTRDAHKLTYYTVDTSAPAGQGEVICVASFLTVHGEEALARADCPGVSLLHTPGAAKRWRPPPAAAAEAASRFPARLALGLALVFGCLAGWYRHRLMALATHSRHRCRGRRQLDSPPLREVKEGGEGCITN